MESIVIDGVEYRVGDRIRLDFTSDRYTRLTLGEFGTITGFWTDDLQIWRVDIRWDDGSNLSMIAGRDKFSKVKEGDEKSRIL